MKDLILIRGVSGSGKSTLAGIIGCSTVSADDYFLDKEGNYKFDSRKLKEAHAWCQEQTEEALKILDGADVIANKTFAVANTFTQEWEMEPYFELAEKYGFRLHTIIVENRHGGVNIHDVPQVSLEKQRKRFNVKL